LKIKTTRMEKRTWKEWKGRKESLDRLWLTYVYLFQVKSSIER
jgi:hypothetical protein